MTSHARSGFPAGTLSTPVPNPLLARMLEEIDDLGELKLTLRVIWALHRKKGSPRFVTAQELCSDRTVARMLAAGGAQLEQAVKDKLDAAVKRGTLLRVGESVLGAGLPARAENALTEADRGPDRSPPMTGDGGSLAQGPGASAVYLLNTEESRRALARRGVAGVDAGAMNETWPSAETAEPRPSVFSYYEENIGPLTPVAAARIEAALQDHTEETIADAIESAVEANARSWNYVAAVLRSRSAEAPAHGKPARDPEAARSAEFIRKYVERQKARGNR
jgi:DnaD/phage-associated family protein